MLESFSVSTSNGAYKVSVGEHLLEKMISVRHAIFLVDDFFGDRLPLNSCAVILIPALETSKNLDYMSGVIEQMRLSGVNRDTHVYAIGGGIIQDIATFVNSIYMRGLAWTYFPSTLLSMADSCIGGKSSINVRGYKNLVGNIYPPTEVFVDMNFCKTLGQDEIIGGLAEAVKICFARGTEFFEQYLALDPLYPMSGEKGVQVITAALQAKKWFIEIDEFDRAERLLLNYGHTFGHALEASSGFAIAHGVAVALGMLVSIKYANLVGSLSGIGKRDCDKLDQYLQNLLAPLNTNIQAAVRKIDFDILMEKFEGDKKHRQDQYRMVIPASEGSLVLHSVPKDQASREVIRQAFRTTFVSHGYLPA